MINLLIPSIKQGRGGGHLKRAVKLMSISVDTRLLLPGAEDSFSIDMLKSMIPQSLYSRIYWSWDEIDQSVNWILLDQFKTDKDLYQRCRKSTPWLMALDEGGPFRKKMDYLLDSLPQLKKKSPPNIFAPSFLFFPTLPDESQKKVSGELLVSFGNEDPEALSSMVINKLIDHFDVAPEEVTLVKGPLYKEQRMSHKVNILKAPESLEPYMKSHKILITSFGITAFEGVKEGLQVLLVNPSRYHQKLSRAAGFSILGVKKLTKRGEAKLKSLLKGKVLQENPLPIEGPTLYNWLKQIKPDNLSCPDCKTENPVIYRKPQGNFYHCSSCRNYYYTHLSNETQDYSDAYFFNDYKKQYGKTYLDDFEHIYQMANSRLQIMEQLHRKKGSLVDLGCAYGPFLKAARDKGYHVRGVEISPKASQWVQQELTIPVLNFSLTDQSLDRELCSKPADAITLWYVIEHFNDQALLLNRINHWIRPGGILAFSTPSGKGISARKNLNRFFDNNPLDHYIIYTPRGVRRVLKHHGFVVKKMVNTGHHPERIITNVHHGSMAYRILLFISKLFRLGDTFEIYAFKE